MQNKYLEARLTGILSSLRACNETGLSMSAASKGREREDFVALFLKQVFPNAVRFGTGDITDKTGNCTGQLDVVVEYPFSPSLPIVAGGSTRLYFADGVAAVIEVKSALVQQWDEVCATARKVASVKRDPDDVSGAIDEFPSERIPFFAVGYDGWKTAKTLKKKLQSGVIDGILVIEHGIYASGKDGFSGAGPLAVLGLVDELHLAIHQAQMAHTHLRDYAR